MDIRKFQHGYQEMLIGLSLQAQILILKTCSLDNIHGMENHSSRMCIFHEDQKNVTDIKMSECSG